MIRLYAALVGLLIIVGMAALIFYYRGAAIASEAELNETKVQLALSVAASKEKDKAILRQEAAIASLNKLMLDVANEVEQINQASREQTAAIAELSEANENVRAFLATVLPPDLSKLLNERR